MNLTTLCGKVAITVSILIVVACIILVALTVFCMCLGAYQSYTNPASSNQTSQEYAELQQNISAGQAAIAHAVPAGSGI